MEPRKEHEIYQQMVDTNIDNLVETLTEQVRHSGLSEEEISKKKEELRATLTGFICDDRNQNRLFESISILMEHIHEYPNDKLCIKELEHAGQVIVSTLEEITPDDIQKLVEASEKLKNEPPKETVLPPPLAETWGLSALTLDTFYQIGSKLYDQNKLDEAISVFLFLTLLNSYSHETWLSLAMCHHRAKEYLYAIQAYMTSSIWDPTDPLAYFYCCECFLEMGDFLNAQESLTMGEHFITKENKARFEPLLTYCKSRVA